VRNDPAEQAPATRDEKEAQRMQQLEAAVLQAHKMVAVGEMTAGIAHDFNNVLAIILGSVDLLEPAIDPADDEAVADLAALREAALRGAAMIRKLMGFSRSTEIHPAPTDLGSLVTGMDYMLQCLLPDYVQLEVVPPEECLAMCDPAAVEQMVLNLVTNARDAMPEGGFVRVWVAPCIVEQNGPRPSWMAPGRYARISVADTGIGMDEETLSHVLEPFFTTKAPGAGTGLGLSMVYGLAKQQGGFIDIASAPGAGTVAHLYLPRALTPTPTEPTAPRP